MPEIRLLQELHSNTRRTRVTYKADVNGQLAALKCYKRPFFGLLHWMRAQRRGSKLRRAQGPVPPVVYSGWLQSQNCFCFATEYLEGYRPLRAVLRESGVDEQFELIRVLGRLMAEVHRSGIEQPDGNLTNFMIDIRRQIAMVDEDDIKVYSASLPSGTAEKNLANIAARFPEKDMERAFLVAYLSNADTQQKTEWDSENYWKMVSVWRKGFEKKRLKRKINPVRHFD